MPDTAPGLGWPATADATAIAGQKPSSLPVLTPRKRARAVGCGCCRSGSVMMTSACAGIATPPGPRAPGSPRASPCGVACCLAGQRAVVERTRRHRGVAQPCPRFGLVHEKRGVVRRRRPGQAARLLRGEGGSHGTSDAAEGLGAMGVGIRSPCLEGRCEEEISLSVGRVLGPRRGFAAGSTELEHAQQERDCVVGGSSAKRATIAAVTGHRHLFAGSRQHQVR